MKSGQKAVKMIFILTIIVEALLFISLLMGSHEYYMTNNVWVEAEDKGLGPIMCVIVILILIPVFMIRLNAKSKSRDQKTVKKTIDIPAAKKHFLSCIGHHIGLLILLRIISERIVRTIVIDLFSLDLSEAAYMAGHYGIFRQYISIMLIVALISDVILVAILCNCKEPLLSSDSSLHNEENDINIREKTFQNKFADSVHKRESTESAMKCPFCGYEQPAGRKVCWKCAKPLIDMVESPTQAIKEIVSENKQCINCGSMINSDDAFCPYCGEKVLKSDENINKNMIGHTGTLCPNCGSKIAADDIFCINCGSRLNN